MRIINRKKRKENQERKKARKKERKTERKKDRQRERERERVRERESALESQVWRYMDFQPPGFVNAAPGAGKIVPRAVAALRWVDQGDMWQPLQQHYGRHIYIHT